MTNSKNIKINISYLYKYLIVIIILWVAVITASLAWDFIYKSQGIKKLAQKEAVTVFNKDAALRYWAAMHGGVYVPITEKTPPNKYLKHIPERDISTPSGKKLTLMNPTYMLKQMMGDFSELYGIRGHITSLDLLNPDNAPDEWERRSLELFETGVEEVFEITPDDDRDYMRLMRPFIVVEDCLRCHAHQGYEVGDVCGGISTSVLLEPYYNLLYKNFRQDTARHSLIWLIGMVAIGFIFRRTKCRLIERKQAEVELMKYRDQLEESIKKRTVELRVEIEEHKRAEEKVQQQNVFLNNVLESLTYPLYVVDAKDYHIVIANSSGWALSDGTIKTCYALTHKRNSPCDGVEYICPLKKIKQTKEPFIVQHLHFDKTGTPRYYEIYAFPILNSEGEVVQMIEYMMDITERKQWENELSVAKKSAEAANRAKSEFLANMSHEIRTPMNAVIGFTELLDSMITDQKQRSYLDSIKTGGKNLLSLINDILDLSKIEAGRMKIYTEPTDIISIFTEIEMIFRQKIAEKNLDFQIEVESGIPLYLSLDETRLRQVLLNLVGNAIKFTEKGYIKLSMWGVQKQKYKNSLDLILAVEDSGIGIPESDQKKIFGAFLQKESQSAKKFGGTGLGLTITKRLVKMMNGVISLKSETGKGSIFEIALRDVAICEVKSETKSAQFFDVKNIEFEKATILVVDDIKMNRRLLQAILKRQKNLRVILANDGRQALLLAREHKPDMILMDLKMPVMDGYEAAKQIKNDADLKRIPITVLTASATKKTKERVKANEFNGRLIKPVDISDLFLEMTRFIPYAEKSAQSEEPKSLELGKISAETLAKLPEVVEKLEGEYMTLWEVTLKSNNFSRYDEFANRIKEMGEIYSLQILKNFGIDLLIYVSSFDIDKIQDGLKIYPQIVKKLAIRLREGKNDGK
ncbi:MAG: hypothetical protein B6244_10905 [Candidatus Cloacimonetes bacterium 4572_55]|nr:MAG: hypothetical protein B6244_10905 [Candidatus Cloacimonetes bacterium 4572_55]